MGRFSVDYAVAWRPARGWTRYALEINLRRGGTSPPMSLLGDLDPGLYEARPGRWLSTAGGTRCYRSTDNLVDPRWLGLEPARAIDAVRGAGLGWDRRRRRTDARLGTTGRPGRYVEPRRHFLGSNTGQHGAGGSRHAL